MKIIFLILIGLVINAFNLLSSDGTWEIVDILNMYENNAEYPMPLIYKGIDCYDRYNCAAAGNLGFIEPVVRMTEDGGNTWFTALIDSTHGDYKPSKVSDIVYTGDKLCIVLCEKNYYWKSTDKGKTWEKGYPGAEYNLLDISFLDESTGGIVSYYKIFVTRDGAKTWDTLSLDLIGNDIPSIFMNIFFVSDSIIILNGIRSDEKKNYIIKTSDGGKTWKAVKGFDRRFEDIFFVNKDLGFVAGSDQFSEGSTTYRDIIYKTTDGGDTWGKKLDSFEEPRKGIRKIYFSDELNGRALGYGEVLWKSSDGGETWIRDSLFDANYFHNSIADIAFIDNENQFCITQNLHTIYKFLPGTNGTLNVRFNDNHITLYPNPLPSGSQLNIKIETEKPGRVEFTVYDALGGRVDEPYARYFDAGVYTVQYSPGQNLAPGTYWLRAVFSDGSTAVKPFVVE